MKPSQRRRVNLVRKPLPRLNETEPQAKVECLVECNFLSSLNETELGAKVEFSAKAVTETQ